LSVALRGAIHDGTATPFAAVVGTIFGYAIWRALVRSDVAHVANPR